MLQDGGAVTENIHDVVNTDVNEADTAVKPSTDCIAEEDMVQAGGAVTENVHDVVNTDVNEAATAVQPTIFCNSNDTGLASTSEHGQRRDMAFVEEFMTYATAERNIKTGTLVLFLQALLYAGKYLHKDVKTSNDYGDVKCLVELRNLQRQAQTAYERERRMSQQISQKTNFFIGQRC
eukprot:gene11625-12823_t